MECRPSCGACCIAPSINTPYYGMPNGKAAGEICVHLDHDRFHCAIWGTKHYPLTCQKFKPEPDICGNSREQAIQIINLIEGITSHTP